MINDQLNRKINDEEKTEFRGSCDTNIEDKNSQGKSNQNPSSQRSRG